MNVRLNHNRRMVSLFLTMVMLIVGSASNASWACADGKPCAPDCRMLHGAPADAASHTSDLPHCAHCASQSASTHLTGSVGGKDCSCSTPRCVLRFSDRPVSSVQQLIAAPILDAVVLPTPIEIGVATPTTSGIVAPKLSFFPQHFLRLHSGRAPPASL